VDDGPVLVLLSLLPRLALPLSQGWLCPTGCRVQLGLHQTPRLNPDPQSQNHRMVGVGRNLCGSSSPTLLPKQGHLQQAAQDLVQANPATLTLALERLPFATSGNQRRAGWEQPSPWRPERLQPDLPGVGAGGDVQSVSTRFGAGVTRGRQYHTHGAQRTAHASRASWALQKQLLPARR